MIYAETRTCILSVIQCSTVQCLLFKCNVSSSSQSVCISLLISQECKQVEKDSPYYDFHYNTRRARPSIVHFQVWFSSVAWQSNFLSKVIIKRVVYGFVYFLSKVIIKHVVYGFVYFLNVIFQNVTMLISCMHAISRDFLVVCMCLVAMIFQVLITSALIEGKLLLIGSHKKTEVNFQ